VKPPPFAYRDPTELEEAVALLAEHGADARPLAGGQSLVPLLNFRLVHPAVLIDLNRIAALSGIRTEAGHAVIGAMTRQCEAERHVTLGCQAPLIAQALKHVGHSQTRSRGTIGGSLAHNDPAAELPAVMLALDATMEIHGKQGMRHVPASAFFVTTLTTALAPNELLTAIHLPRVPAGAGTGFAEVARRHGDFALAAAAVLAWREGGRKQARIVVTGMGEGPQRVLEAEAALTEQDLKAKSLADVAAAVERTVRPSGDLHAPGWYRKKVAGVVAARACRDALARMAP
jgi:carbon-monoxide dehydrogenase medium subunit